MTKEALAEKLNGREYSEEISDAESKEAKKHGLLVIFGYSDDAVELRGAVNDEVRAYEGAEFHLHREEPILVQPHDEDCECEFCGFKQLVERSAVVKAVWCKTKQYSWTYETQIPHATFDIMEDGDKFCRGIVIDIKDLPKL